jgi:hypothetical protein
MDAPERHLQGVRAKTGRERGTSMPDERKQPPLLPDDDSLSLVEGVQALRGEELPDDQATVRGSTSRPGPA